MHAHRLRDLNADGPFPRFTPAELMASGYPDHLHAFTWPGWRPLVDAAGRLYGPGSLCERGQPRPSTVWNVEPGHLTYGPITLTHPAVYRACDVAFFVELCELARVRCRDLLGLERGGRLHLISPDSLPAYASRTGHGAWRLYALRGDTCITQPLATLLARTLAGHAAVELTTLWTLNDPATATLPVWLRFGLAGYLADMGVHLNNFMAPYRQHGPVLLPPHEIDRILIEPPAADPVRDQSGFRQASYSAFVMAWWLVENEGGLVCLRELLSAVSAGTSLDSACRLVYGCDLAGLAARLDPTIRGEPIGSATQPRTPHQPPADWGET